MRMSLEKGMGKRELTTEMMKWLNEQEQVGVWKDFKVAFAEKFVTDKTNTTATERYESFFQGKNVTTEDFFDEFCARAEAAAFCDETPPENWKTNMPLFAGAFLQKLKQEISMEVIDRGKEFLQVKTNLLELARLAIDCEKVLTIKKAAKAATQQTSSSNKQHEGDRKKRQQRTPRSTKMSNHRDNTGRTPKEGMLCTICARTNHMASNCRARYYADGTPLKKNNDAAGDGDSRKRCYSCKLLGHTQRTCPNKFKNSTENRINEQQKVIRLLRKRLRKEEEGQQSKSKRQRVSFGNESIPSSGNEADREEEGMEDEDNTWNGDTQ
jgi:hypothetical protein